MKQNEDNETRAYAQMGMAAMLPGMQRMLELMQREVEEMRQRLNHLQNHQPAKVGRPRRKAASSGWPADPEERSLEMKRRQKVAALKKGKSGHPRDPNHPGHAEWLKKTGRAAKKRWRNMSVRDRKARLAAMAAGRQKPVVQLEKAS